MLPSKWHLTIEIPETSTKAAAVQQAHMLMVHAQRALKNLDATWVDGESAFSVVVQVHDPRSYACITFELALYSKWSDSGSRSLDSPTAFIMDMTRWRGDAFFFGGIVFELRTVMKERVQDPAWLSESTTPGSLSVPNLPLRTGEEAALYMHHFPYFTTPDKLAAMACKRQLGMTGADDAIGTAASLATASTGSHAQGSPGSAELLTDADQTALARVADNMVASLTKRQGGGGSGGQGSCAAVDAAAVRLCRQVTEDTHMGQAAPASGSITSAIAGQLTCMLALADALPTCRQKRNRELTIPLTMATARIVCACMHSSNQDSGRFRDGMHATHSALAQLQAADFFLPHGSVPRNVVTTVKRAVALTATL